MKKIKITYLKKSVKFLQKNRNLISESDVERLIILTIKKKIFRDDVNVDCKELRGELKGKMRIRKGNIRVIITIKEDERVADALRMMKEYSIGGIPVVRENNKLVGIVSNRDLRFERNLGKYIYQR